MDEQTKSVARTCLEDAENGARTFPQIVGALMQAGFESYLVDYRRAVTTYYLPDGDSVEFRMQDPGPVAAAFDASPIRAAIREAQDLAPDYTYAGFCRKVTASGCAGYLVSFPGRRVLYFGRTAELHVEHFPN